MCQTKVMLLLRDSTSTSSLTVRLTAVLPVFGLSHTELDKFDRLRTWQSLKDHFRRVVLPRMKNEDDNSDNAGSTKAKKKKPKAGRLSLTSA